MNNKLYRNIYLLLCLFIFVACQPPAPEGRTRSSFSRRGGAQQSNAGNENSNGSSKKDGEVKIITQGTEVSFPDKYRQSYSPNTYIAGFIELGADSDGKALRGLYLRPGGSMRSGPLLIAIHGTNGLDDSFLKLLLRYLSDNTQVFALDLYQKVPQSSDQAKSFERTLNDQPSAKLMAFVQFAMQELRKKNRKISQYMVMGWGQGGRRAVDIALTVPEISMVIDYYGHPFSIMDKVDLFKIPMIGFFAENDTEIPVSRLSELEQKLKDEDNNGFKKIIYPSAPPGFMDESLEIYDANLTQKAVEASMNAIKNATIQ